MKNEYWATPIWSWPVDGIDPRDIVAEVLATKWPLILLRLDCLVRFVVEV